MCDEFRGIEKQNTVCLNKLNNHEKQQTHKTEKRANAFGIILIQHPHTKW